MFDCSYKPNMPVPAFSNCNPKKNIEQSQFKFGISFVSIRTTLLDKGEGAGRDKVKLVTLMLVLSLLAEDTLHLLAALASTGGDSLSLSAL